MSALATHTEVPQQLLTGLGQHAGVRVMGAGLLLQRSLAVGEESAKESATVLPPAR